MYVIVAGGGKVGANLTRSLIGMGHEVTLIEQQRGRYERLDEELEHRVQLGDATEIHVLERAGIGRPPEIVIAATGDDEDNIIICQLALEKYAVPKVVARVNDPRNQPHFDLLGIGPTVCATSSLLALVEHEVPEHGLVHLLELRKENLEIVEVQIEDRSPCLGKALSGLQLPEGSQSDRRRAQRRDLSRRRLARAPAGRPGARRAALGHGGRATPRAAYALAALAALLFAAIAGATSARSELKVVRVARGLEAPVYVTAPRSQPTRLYIVEQTGRILVLDKGKLLKKPFLDIRCRVGSAGTEQGLLSMAFHPGYAKNHRYYVDYTDRNGDTRVVEFRSSGLTTKTSTARQLLFVRQPFANHNGGQLQFGPDGKLYVGMGDGGSADDPREQRPEPGEPAREAPADEPADRRAGRSRATAYATRGASRSIARPVTS